MRSPVKADPARPVVATVVAVSAVAAVTAADADAFDLKKAASSGFFNKSEGQTLSPAILHTIPTKDAAFYSLPPF